MAFLPGLRDLRHRLILWLACGQALDREPGEAVRLERARDAKVQIAEVRFGEMEDGAAAQPLPGEIEDGERAELGFAACAWCRAA